jgi:hypothetical protein
MPVTWESRACQSESRSRSESLIQSHGRAPSVAAGAGGSAGPRTGRTGPGNVKFAARFVVDGSESLQAIPPPSQGLLARPAQGRSPPSLKLSLTRSLRRLAAAIMSTVTVSGCRTVTVTATVTVAVTVTELGTPASY